ncbi:ABC transporter ATP-binding protein [Owenweeksia hongkongensis]|nr:ABC transporter ATP-binding protein [Owenweeksia hongkongensis]
MNKYMKDEAIVEVNGVYKKFCTNLKLNMLYGLQDIFRFNNSTDLPPLRRKEFWALQDVNLNIHRGEVVGVLGMNGAGKTTLIRTIMGAFPPTHGSIKVNGRITTVFERARAFQKFYSGVENIRVKCALFGMPTEEIDARLGDILRFAGVKKFADAPFGSYSAGMRARINFAVAIFARPDLLIIDEGLAVSDVHFRKKCMDTLHSIREDTGVLLVSHNMEQFEELATRLVIMEKGRIIGETDDIAYGIKQVMDKKGKTKIK